MAKFTEYYNVTRAPLSVTLLDGTPEFVPPKGRVRVRHEDRSASLYAAVANKFLRVTAEIEESDDVLVELSDHVVVAEKIKDTSVEELQSMPAPSTKGRRNRKV